VRLVQCGLGHVDAILGGSICLALGFLKRGEKAMGDPVNSSVDVTLLQRCLAMAASAVGIATTTTSAVVLRCARVCQDARHAMRANDSSHWYEPDA
jgi:hypothetical protein